MMDHLAILSKTIADHARQEAEEEWRNEYGSFLNQILTNTGLGNGSTLEVDGRSIPVESITKALREEFLRVRSAQLMVILTDSVVETAFKKVIDDENTVD